MPPFSFVGLFLLVLCFAGFSRLALFETLTTVSQLPRVVVNLADGGGYLVHVGAAPQEHGLEHPDRLLVAQPVVLGAMIVLLVRLQAVPGVDRLEGAGVQRLREKWLFVEGRVSPVERNALVRSKP